MRRKGGLWTAKPLPHQVEVLESDARFKMAACGRRWGKTGAAIKAGLSGHGSRRQFRGVRQGGNIWWVAPSYPQIITSQVWEVVKRCSQAVATDVSEVDMTIRYVNGGSFSVRSAARRTSIVGAGLDGLILDEAAFLSKESWHEALRPSLADKLGWCLQISTPNGHNWWYDEFRSAEELDDWEAWQRPSSDNPLMTADEMDAIKLQIGARSFAQEHLAEFVQMAGSEWGPEHFVDVWPDYWPTSFRAGVIAIDPSRGKDPTRGDYGAIVFIGLTEDSPETLWIDAIVERLPTQQLVEAAVEMYLEHKPDAMGVENAANQDLVFLPAIQKEATGMHGLPPLPLWTIDPDVQKERRIFRLNPLIVGRHLRFRPGSVGCRRLLDQLLGFPLRTVHDDGPDAMEQAYRLLKTVILGDTEGYELQNYAA